MRQFLHLPIHAALNIRALNGYSPVAYLDRARTDRGTLLAIGEVDSFRLESPGSAFNELKKWRVNKKDHVFGHFGYELKNDEHSLNRSGQDQIASPVLYFFQPELLLKISINSVEVGYFPERSSQNDLRELVDILFSHSKSQVEFGNTAIKLKERTQKSTYIDHVNRLKEHIAVGDIYEANYCVEMYNENVQIDPLVCYETLIDLTQAPYSCYYKFDGVHVLCASPERFMKFGKGVVTSEPMKGTIRRGKDQVEDEALKARLAMDPKERAENVMIVDLVRNDLSKHAVKDSVRVDGLFEVKSFKTVHQMVSTVSAKVKEGTSAEEIIRDAFPMGSMTGAPKVRAMELIDEHEDMPRGIYSGSIGYFEPNGDFDFNVVIRSIIYNEQTKYLSLKVGSAITAGSDPEKEYDECMLKAEALMKALS